jgi:hypothetical protein
LFATTHSNNDNKDRHGQEIRKAQVHSSAVEDLNGIPRFLGLHLQYDEIPKALRAGVELRNSQLTTQEYTINRLTRVLLGPEGPELQYKQA